MSDLDTETDTAITSTVWGQEKNIIGGAGKNLKLVRNSAAGNPTKLKKKNGKGLEVTNLWLTSKRTSTFNYYTIEEADYLSSLIQNIWINAVGLSFGYESATKINVSDLTANIYLGTSSTSTLTDHAALEVANASVTTSGFLNIWQDAILALKFNVSSLSVSELQGSGDLTLSTAEAQSEGATLTLANGGASYGGALTFVGTQALNIVLGSGESQDDTITLQTTGLKGTSGANFTRSTGSSQNIILKITGSDSVNSASNITIDSNILLQLADAAQQSFVSSSISGGLQLGADSTLSLDSSSLLGNVTLGEGSTLSLTGATTISGALTLSGNATFGISWVDGLSLAFSEINAGDYLINLSIDNIDSLSRGTYRLFADWQESWAGIFHFDDIIVGHRSVCFSDGAIVVTAEELVWEETDLTWVDESSLMENGVGAGWKMEGSANYFTHGDAVEFSNAAGGTVTLGADITTDDMTIADGMWVFDAADYTLNVVGTLDIGNHEITLSGGSFNLAGLAGSGTIEYSGAGLTITDASSFTGEIQVGAAWRISQDLTLGTSGCISVSSAGQLVIGDSVALTGNLSLNRAGTSSDTDAAITFGNGVVLNGSITLTGNTRLLSGSGTIINASVDAGGYDLQAVRAGVITINGEVTNLKTLKTKNAKFLITSDLTAESLAASANNTLTLGQDTASGGGVAGMLELSGSVSGITCFVNEDNRNNGYGHDFKFSGSLTLDQETTFSGAGSFDIAGQLLGSGSIVKQGAGSLTLNTSGGGIDVAWNGGNFNLGNITGSLGAVSIGSADLSGTVQGTWTLTALDVSADRLSWTGNGTLKVNKMSGVGNMSRSGGNLEILATSDYSGTLNMGSDSMLTLAEGVTFGGSLNLSKYGSNNNANQGALIINRGSRVSGKVTLASNTRIECSDDTYLSGGIDGNDFVLEQAWGNLFISGDIIGISKISLVNCTMTIESDLTEDSFNNQTLTLERRSDAANDGELYLKGAVSGISHFVNNNEQTTADKKHDMFFTGSVTLSQGADFSGVGSFKLTDSSVLGGSGSFTKEGIGTLTIGGTIEHTGSLVVNAGTVVLNSNAASMTGGVTLGGGTLTLGGGGGTLQSLTLNAASTVTLNSNWKLGSQLTVDVTNALTLNGECALELTSGAEVSSSITLTDNSLILSGGTLDLSRGSLSGSGTLAISVRSTGSGLIDLGSSYRAASAIFGDDLKLDLSTVLSEGTSLQLFTSMSDWTWEDGTWDTFSAAILDMVNRGTAISPRADLELSREGILTLSDGGAIVLWDGGDTGVWNVSSAEGDGWLTAGQASTGFIAGDLVLFEGETETVTLGGAIVAGSMTVNLASADAELTLIATSGTSLTVNNGLDLQQGKIVVDSSVTGVYALGNVTLVEGTELRVKVANANNPFASGTSISGAGSLVLESSIDQEGEGVWLAIIGDVAPSADKSLHEVQIVNSASYSGTSRVWVADDNQAKLAYVENLVIGDGVVFAINQNGFNYTDKRLRNAEGRVIANVIHLNGDGNGDTRGALHSTGTSRIDWDVTLDSDASISVNNVTMTIEGAVRFADHTLTIGHNSTNLANGTIVLKNIEEAGDIRVRTGTLCLDFSDLSSDESVHLAAHELDVTNKNLKLVQTSGVVYGVDMLKGSGTVSMEGTGSATLQISNELTSGDAFTGTIGSDITANVMGGYWKFSGTLNGGMGVSGGTLEFTASTSKNIALSGSGTLLLNGAQFGADGGVTATSGTVQIGAGGLTLNGGVLNLTGSVELRSVAAAQGVSRFSAVQPIAGETSPLISISVASYEGDDASYALQLGSAQATELLELLDEYNLRINLTGTLSDSANILDFLDGSVTTDVKRGLAAHIFTGSVVVDEDKCVKVGNDGVARVVNTAEVTKLVWGGGNGNWSDINWDDTPTNSDDGFISWLTEKDATFTAGANNAGGTVTIDSAITVGSLTIEGGAWIFESEAGTEAAGELDSLTIDSEAGLTLGVAMEVSGQVELEGALNVAAETTVSGLLTTGGSAELAVEAALSAGALSGSGDIFANVGKTGTITITGLSSDATSATFSGSITRGETTRNGTVSLVMDASNFTQTLSGAFNGGGITVEAGNLSLTGSSITAGAVAVEDGTLTLGSVGSSPNASSAVSLSSIVNDSTLTVTGASLSVTGNVSSSSELAVGAERSNLTSVSIGGNLTVSAGHAGIFAESVTIGTAGQSNSLTVTGTAELTVDGTGTGGLTLNGALNVGGNEVLTKLTMFAEQGTLTVTGATTVQSGEVKIQKVRNASMGDISVGSTGGYALFILGYDGTTDGSSEDPTTSVRVGTLTVAGKGDSVRITGQRISLAGMALSGTTDTNGTSSTTLNGNVEVTQSVSVAATAGLTLNGTTHSVVGGLELNGSLTLDGTLTLGNGSTGSALLSGSGSIAGNVGTDGAVNDVIVFNGLSTAAATYTGSISNVNVKMQSGKQTLSVGMNKSMSLSTLTMSGGELVLDGSVSVDTLSGTSGTLTLNGTTTVGALTSNAATLGELSLNGKLDLSAIDTRQTLTLSTLTIGSNAELAFAIAGEQAGLLLDLTTFTAPTGSNKLALTFDDEDDTSASTLLGLTNGYRLFADGNWKDAWAEYFDLSDITEALQKIDAHRSVSIVNGVLTVNTSALELVWTDSNHDGNSFTWKNGSNTANDLTDNWDDFGDTVFFSDHDSVTINGATGDDRSAVSVAAAVNASSLTLSGNVDFTGFAITVQAVEGKTGTGILTLNSGADVSFGQDVTVDEIAGAGSINGNSNRLIINKNGVNVSTNFTDVNLVSNITSTSGYLELKGNFAGGSITVRKDPSVTDNTISGGLTEILGTQIGTKTNQTNITVHDAGLTFGDYKYGEAYTARTMYGDITGTSSKGQILLLNSLTLYGTVKGDYGNILLYDQDTETTDTDPILTIINSGTAQFDGSFVGQIKNATTGKLASASVGTVKFTGAGTQTLRTTVNVKTFSVENGTLRITDIPGASLTKAFSAQNLTIDKGAEVEFSKTHTSYTNNGTEYKYGDINTSTITVSGESSLTLGGTSEVVAHTVNLSSESTMKVSATGTKSLGNITLNGGSDLTFSGLGDLATTSIKVNGGSTVTFESTATASKKLGTVTLDKDSEMIVKTNTNWTSGTVSGAGTLVFDGLTITDRSSALNLVATCANGATPGLANVRLTNGSSITFGFGSPHLTANGIGNLWVEKGTSVIMTSNMAHAFGAAAQTTLHLAGTGIGQNSAAFVGVFATSEGTDYNNTLASNIALWGTEGATMSVTGYMRATGSLKLGSYTLTKTGAGTMNLAGSIVSGDTGTLDIQTGTLMFSYTPSATSTTAGYTVKLADNTTLNLNSAETSYTIDHLIGAGTVTGLATDTLVIGYSPTNATSIAESTASVNTISLTMAGTGHQKITGAFTGKGITVNSSGTLTLGSTGSAVAATGDASITTGTLVFGTTGNSIGGTLSGATGGSLVFANGTDTLTAGAMSGTLNLKKVSGDAYAALAATDELQLKITGLTNTTATTTYEGSLQGVSSITMSGGHTQKFTADASSKSISVSAGTLQLTHSALSFTSSNLSLTGGTLELGTAGTEAAPTSVTLTGDWTVGTGALKLHATTNTISGTLNAGSATTAGSIDWDNLLQVGALSGSKDISKSSANLTITGTNANAASAYTGTMTINTLTVNDASATASHSIKKISATTLNMADGKLGLTDGGTVGKLNGTAGELTIAGTLTLNGLENGATLTSLAVNGTLNVTAAKGTLNLGSMTVGEDSALNLAIGEEGDGFKFNLTGALTAAEAGNKLALSLSQKSLEALKDLGKVGYQLFTGTQTNWAEFVDLSGIIPTDLRWQLELTEGGVLRIAVADPMEWIWTDSKHEGHSFTWSTGNAEGTLDDWDSPYGDGNTPFAQGDVVTINGNETDAAQVTVQTTGVTAGDLTVQGNVGFTGGKITVASGGDTTHGTLTIGDSAKVSFAQDVSAAKLSGAGSITGTTGKTLTLTGDGSSASTSLTGVSLKVDGSNANSALSGSISGGSVTVNSGTLSLTNAALSLTGTDLSIGTGAKLALGTAAGTVQFKGFTLASGATLALNGSTNTIKSATMSVADDTKFTWSSLTVDTGATLEYTDTAVTMNGTLSGAGTLKMGGELTLTKATGKSYTIGTLDVAGSLTLKGDALTISSADLGKGTGATAKSLTLDENAALAGSGTLTLNGGTLTLTSLGQLGTDLKLAEGAVNNVTVEQLTDADIDSENSDELYGKVVIDFTSFTGTVPSSIGEILGQTPESENAYTGAVELKGKNFTLAGTDTTSFHLIILDRTSGLTMADNASIGKLLIDGEDDGGLETHGATIWVNGADDVADIQNLLGYGYFTKDGDGTLRIMDGLDSFYGGIRVENGTLALEYANEDGKLIVTDDHVDQWNGIYITSTGTLKLGNSDGDIKEVEVQKDVHLEGGNLRMTGTEANMLAGDVSLDQRRDSDTEIGGSDYATSMLILSEAEARYTITGVLRNTERVFDKEYGELADAEVWINVGGAGDEYTKAGLRKLSVGAMEGDFRLMMYDAGTDEGVEFSEAKLELIITHVGDATAKMDAEEVAKPLTNTTYSGKLTGVGSIQMLGNGIQSFTEAYAGDLLVDNAEQGTLEMRGMVTLSEAHKLTLNAGVLGLSGGSSIDGGATVTVGDGSEDGVDSLLRLSGSASHAFGGALIVHKDAEMEVAMSADKAGAVGTASVSGTLTMDGKLSLLSDLSADGLSGNGQVDASAGTLIINGDGGSFSGSFSGKLEMKATGTQSMATLSNADLTMTAGTLALTQGGAINRLKATAGTVEVTGALTVTEIASNASLTSLKLNDGAKLNIGANKLEMGSLSYGRDVSLDVTIGQGDGTQLVVKQLQDTTGAGKVQIALDKDSLAHLREVGAWDLFGGSAWDATWESIFDLGGVAGLHHSESLVWDNGKIMLLQDGEWVWDGSAGNAWRNHAEDNWQTNNITPDQKRDGWYYDRTFDAAKGSQEGVVSIVENVEVDDVYIKSGSYTFTGEGGLEMQHDDAVLYIGGAGSDASLELAQVNKRITNVQLDVQGTLTLSDDNAIQGATYILLNGGTLVWSEKADGALYAADKGLTNTEVADGARLQLQVGEQGALANDGITLGGAASTVAPAADGEAKSALESALSDGLSKSGRHELTIEWAGDTNAAGDIELNGGGLTLDAHGNVIVSGGLSLADGTRLTLKAENGATMRAESAFMNSGAGDADVIIGSETANGDYTLAADNSAFSGKISLAGDSKSSSVTVETAGALGGAGTTLELAGRNLNVTGAAKDITVKAIDVAADTAVGGANVSLTAGSITGDGALATAGLVNHVLNSDLSGFGGWIVAGKGSTWTLKSDAAVTALATKLTGNGTISIAYTGSNTLELTGQIGSTEYGMATSLENAMGAGKTLALAHADTKASGSLIFHDNTIQLGTAGKAGAWGGSSLENKGSGEARLVLVQGTLAQALTPAAGVSVEVNALGVVNAGATSGSSFHDIEIHGEQGGRLVNVAGDITAGGEDGIRVRLSFGADNIGDESSIGTGDYLITSSGSLKVNGYGESGLELNFSNEALMGILLKHRVEDYKSALHILGGGGTLEAAEGLSWDAVVASTGQSWDLLRSIGFNVVGAESGELVIAGTSKDVYLVLNEWTYGNGLSDNPDAKSRAHEVGEYGILSGYKTTVVDAGETLTVTLGELTTESDDAHVQTDIANGGLTVNNLVGLRGATFEGKRADGVAGEVNIVLNNSQIVGDIDELGLDHVDEDAKEAVKGLDTVFMGTITGAEGVNYSKMGAGTLTVGDDDSHTGGLQLEGGFALYQGGLAIQGSRDSHVSDFVFAYDEDAAEDAKGGLEVTHNAWLTVNGALHEVDGKAGSSIRLEDNGKLIMKGSGDLHDSGIISSDGTGSLDVQGSLALDATEKDDKSVLAGVDTTVSGDLLVTGGGSVSESDVTVENGGDFTLDGGSTMKDSELVVNEGGTGAVTGGSGVLGDADISVAGSLTVSDGGSIDLGKGDIDISGNLTVQDSAAGSHIATVGSLNVDGTLDLGRSRGNSVGYFSGSGTLAGGSGSELTVNGKGNVFSGTLAGSSAEGSKTGGGMLHVGADAALTLDNVTTEKDFVWNADVDKGSSLTVDVRGGSSDTDLDVTLQDGSSFSYIFDADRKARWNGKLAVKGKVDVTLEADGALLSEDSTLGDIFLVEGSEDNLLDRVHLKGTALVGLEGVLSKGSNGKLGLVFSKSEDNIYLTAGMSRNPSAGAELLWEAVTPDSAGRKYIDSHDGDLSKLYNIITYRAQNDQDSQQTLAALAGSSASVLGQAVTDGIKRQLNSIRNRAGEMYDTVINADGRNWSDFAMWINAESGYHKQDAQGYAPGYTLNGWGGTVGADVKRCKHINMGVSLTAMYNDLKTSSADGGHGDIDGTYVNAHLRMKYGAWSHTFAATAGLVNASLSRSVSADCLYYGFMADSCTAKMHGETEGYALGAMYEVGYAFTMSESGNTLLQPVANVQLRRASLNGYTETGSDAGLRVDDISQDTVTLGMGARLQSLVGQNAFNRNAMFEAHAMMKVDIGDRRGTAETALLRGNGLSESVESAKAGAVGVEIGAGLSVPINSRSGAIFIDASAEFRSNYTNVNASAGYRMNF